MVKLLIPLHKMDVHSNNVALTVHQQVSHACYDEQGVGVMVSPAFLLCQLTYYMQPSTCSSC